MNNRVMVSIICNTYNHEQYIREAIEGFLKQKTDFLYEVLIHDDASTDNTPLIIKEYEERFPEIIKPIYQTENQYSKKIPFAKIYQYPRVRGRYIAICEGDDYWIDTGKLQKQFDALESHPEIDMCVHAAYKTRNGKICGVIAPRSETTIIPTGDVILGGGGLVATNSIFYRASMRETTPKFADCLGLDYILQIWGSLRGGLLYLSDYMSCYRVSVNGSWSSRMSANSEASIAHAKRVNSVLNVLNEDTNGIYSDAIELHIAENTVKILEQEHKYCEIKSGKYETIYNGLPYKKKIKINAMIILQKLGLYK